MSNPASFLSPQFLAEQQHFMRRLAIGLARDEARAEDLVQETWLVALKHGSKAIVFPRAWLATAMRRRAANLSRDENLRRVHEAAAARAEATEDGRLHERVSFQHSVVAAVLALDEPYRSVVMLRYFQGLSPAAIARRRRIPAATVRSQLSRAHAQLRTRLEAREGGREAWCLALAGFLEHPKPTLLSAPALATAAAVCASLGTLAGAWLWAHRETSSMEAGLAIVEPVAAPAPIVEPILEAARVAVMAHGPQSLSPAAIHEGPTQEDLAAKSFDELGDMLTRVEDELRGRLLVPDAEAVSTWSSAHPASQMEFARLLDRSSFNAEFDSGPVGVRGGGAYYSFVRRSHSYDDEPTLGLDGDRLLGAFYGAAEAVLQDLGPIDPAAIPAGLGPQDASLFSLISKGPALPRDKRDAALDVQLSNPARSACALALDHTYLLRGVSPDEHDILAIFVPIHEDRFGITIAWRLLQTWPVARPPGERASGPPRKTLAPEAWTAAMSTDGLLWLLGRIRVLPRHD